MSFVILSYVGLRFFLNPLTESTECDTVFSFLCHSEMSYWGSKIFQHLLNLEWTSDPVIVQTINIFHLRLQWAGRPDQRYVGRQVLLLEPTRRYPSPHPNWQTVSRPKLPELQRIQPCWGEEIFLQIFSEHTAVCPVHWPDGRQRRSAEPVNWRRTFTWGPSFTIFLERMMIWILPRIWLSGGEIFF